MGDRRQRPTSASARVSGRSTAASYAVSKRPQSAGARVRYTTEEKKHSNLWFVNEGRKRDGGSIGLVAFSEIPNHLSDETIHEINVLERRVENSWTNFGAASPEYLEWCIKLVTLYNTSATESLQRGDHDVALELLRSADAVIVHSNNKRLRDVRQLTLNNFGCFFRRTGEPQAALEYLLLAQSLGEQLLPHGESNLAGTLLNLCAVYSALGRHRDALAAAEDALQILLKLLDEEEAGSPPRLTPSMLAIAYYNAGVEQEIIGRRASALLSYECAVMVAEKKLGGDADLTKKMRDVLTTAKSQAASESQLNKPQVSKNTNPPPPSRRATDEEKGPYVPDGLAEIGVRPKSSKHKRDRQIRRDPAGDPRVPLSPPMALSPPTPPLMTTQTLMEPPPPPPVASLPSPPVSPQVVPEPRSEIRRVPPQPHNIDNQLKLLQEIAEDETFVEKSRSRSPAADSDGKSLTSSAGRGMLESLIPPPPTSLTTLQALLEADLLLFDATKNHKPLPAAHRDSEERDPQFKPKQNRADAIPQTIDSLGISRRSSRPMSAGFSRTQTPTSSSRPLSASASTSTSRPLSASNQRSDPYRPSSASNQRAEFSGPTSASTQRPDTYRPSSASTQRPDAFRPGSARRPMSAKGRMPSLFEATGTIQRVWRGHRAREALRTMVPRSSNPREQRRSRPLASYGRVTNRNGGGRSTGATQDGRTSLWHDDDDDDDGVPLSFED